MNGPVVAAAARMIVHEWRGRRGGDGRDTGGVLDVGRARARAFVALAAEAGVQVKGPPEKMWVLADYGGVEAGRAALNLRAEL